MHSKTPPALLDQPHPTAAPTGWGQAGFEANVMDATSRPHPWLSRLLAPPGCGRPDLLRRAVGGKVVLVTGASRGIGAALALRAGAAGATVLLAARGGEALSDLARAIASAGGLARVVPLDLADPGQVARAAEEVLRRCDGVDVVVHNAGKSIRRSLSLSLNRPHDFQRCMAVNYLGPVQLQLALLPAMLARGSGHIVSVSSVGVRLPPAPRWAAYTASKAAFDVWMGAAAPELRPAGIACTSVYLGLVHTRMSGPTPIYRTMPGQSPDEAAQVLCRALIRQPRTIAPWWLAPARLLTLPLTTPTEWVLSRLFLRGQDSPAAQGRDGQ